MSSLMSGLYIVLAMLIIFIMILIFIYWMMSRKEKMQVAEEEKASNLSATNTKVAKEYTKKSISSGSPLLNSFTLSKTGSKSVPPNPFIFQEFSSGNSSASSKCSSF